MGYCSDHKGWESKQQSRFGVSNRRVVSNLGLTELDWRFPGASLFPPLPIKAAHRLFGSRGLGQRCTSHKLDLSWGALGERRWEGQGQGSVGDALSPSLAHRVRMQMRKTFSAK